MPAAPFSRHSAQKGLALPRGFFAMPAALLWAALFSGTAPASDGLALDRALARNAAMYDIAVIQAQAGDILGAKRTAWQIQESPTSCQAPSNVLGVWFVQGQPWYGCLLPMETIEPLGQADAQAARRRSGDPNRSVAAQPVALRPPHGLPADYLAPDGRHGRIVGFFEDVDAHGTRVTSRKYADGHLVIETLRPSLGVAEARAAR